MIKIAREKDKILFASLLFSLTESVERIPFIRKICLNKIRGSQLTFLKSTTLLKSKFGRSGASQNQKQDQRSKLT